MARRMPHDFLKCTTTRAYWNGCHRPASVARRVHLSAPGMRNRNRSWVTRIAVALLLLIVSLHASPAVAATITYVYDPLGRLVAVIDDPGASNDSVIYHYDAVGNLIQVSRQSAATVAIIDFTRREAPPRTGVTI